MAFTRLGVLGQRGQVIQSYLAAYDRQLRAESESLHALETTRLGPLWVSVFPGGRGFVSYADLNGADEDGIGALIDAVLSYFRSRGEIDTVEWKTRGHDRAPGLHEALTARGFVADDPESIMIGEAALLAVDVPLPDGVVLRRAATAADVWAMEEMQGSVFDDPHWRERAEASVARLEAESNAEMWIAVLGEQIVSAGRLEPVDGTEFAGLWGGSTLPQWRGRGIYRALTAQRARAALAQGKRYLQSDSTEFSRPILERSGLITVSTTTPYIWHHSAG